MQGNTSPAEPSRQPHWSVLTIKQARISQTPNMASTSRRFDTRKADDSNAVQQDRQTNGFLFLVLWAPLRPTLYLCQSLQFTKNKARDNSNLTGQENNGIQVDRLPLGPLFYDALSTPHHKRGRTRQDHPPPGPSEQGHCPLCSYLRSGFLPTSLQRSQQTCNN